MEGFAVLQRVNSETVRCKHTKPMAVVHQLVRGEQEVPRPEVFAVVGEAGHPTSVPNHDPAASGNDRSRRSGDFC